MIDPRSYKEDVTPAEAMATSKFFRDYRSAFVAATGCNLVVLNPDGSSPFDTVSRPLGTAETAACAARFGLDGAVAVHRGNHVFALLALAPTEAGGRGYREWQDTAPEATKSGPPRSAAIGSFHRESLVRVLEFFGLQLTDWFEQFASSHTLRNRPRLVRMLEWLNEHYQEPITLDDAGKAVGLSPWTFSKNFHELAGIGFGDFLRQLRVSHAKRLLADPRILHQQVAAAVGFQSISQFNRVFRQVAGCTAGEFRRRLVLQRATSSSSANET